MVGLTQEGPDVQGRIHPNTESFNCHHQEVGPLLYEGDTELEATRTGQAG